jgi:hypothetical protein
MQEAQLEGVAKRIRGTLWRDAKPGGDPERQARHRAEWPELWDALDRLVEIIDDMYPPFGRTSRGLFEPPA